MRRALIGALAVMVVMCASRARAQEDQWKGLHVGVEFGPAPQTLDVAAASEQVNQLTGITISGRGQIVVPPTVIAAPASSLSGTSFIAGAEAGWDRPITDRWIVGGIADVDLGGSSNTTSFSGLVPATLLTPVTTITTTRKVSGGGGLALRARGGYIWRDTFFYGTAGVAFVRVKLSATGTWSDPGGQGVSDGGVIATLGPLGPDVTTVPEAAHFTSGSTFGFGAERMLKPMLAVGVEYRHTSLGTTTFGNSDANTTYQGSLTGNTTTTGVGNGAVIPGATDVKLHDNRILLRASWFPGR